MNCFKSISIQEQTIQKSRFIGYTFIGETKQDILRALQSIAKEHPHASHLAFAYQLKSEHGFEPYYSDAGEPSGTAGKPLLQLIDAHQIVGGGIGVIRYYGGVNLGTGGLTRAYGGTGKLALTHSVIEPYIEYIKLKLTIIIIHNINNIVLLRAVFILMSGFTFLLAWLAHNNMYTSFFVLLFYFLLSFLQLWLLD